MYMPSALFRAAYLYAVKTYDLLAILSARYGLLMPEDEIEPYNVTLKNMNIKQRIEWANMVFNQLQERIGLHKINECYFHAGKDYREFLMQKLEKMGVKCYVPVKGLSLGEQICWYKKLFQSENLQQLWIIPREMPY